MKEALFTSQSGVDPGVFDSQVLGYGRFLESLGIRFRYLLFEGFRAWSSSGRRVEALLRGYRQEFDVQIQMRYLFRPLSRPGLRKAAAHIEKAARNLNRHQERVLIQARGVPAAWAALEAKRRLRSAMVLYDARDDPGAEARMEARGQGSARERRRWESRAVFLDGLESRVCREADHVLAVSEPLRERVCALGNRPAESVTVVPCCLDPMQFSGVAPTRAETRERLRVENRVVLVYSGSLSVWQVPGRMAALVEEVERRLPETHFLLLTRDRAEADRHFAHLARRGSCTVIECGHGEVGRYLAASDAALLLREDDPVNQVACPVKFAEYQACGLPVILTSAIGDVSEYVQRTGYGRIVRLEDPVAKQAEEIVNLLSAAPDSKTRGEITGAALKRFSRESYRVAYAGMLDRLGFGGPQSGAESARGASATGGSAREGGVG